MLLFDSEKVMNLPTKQREDLAWFIVQYAAPKSESAELKGIPNTLEALAQVDVLRSVILRKAGGKHTTAVRIKGRGANRRTRGGNAFGLTHAQSETFALYVHNDYNRYAA